MNFVDQFDNLVCYTHTLTTGKTWKLQGNGEKISYTDRIDIHGNSAKPVMRGSEALDRKMVHDA